ncbi:MULTISPECIES: Crp/Fnr family transcriptional regulator [Parabacteroides]|uniref:Crp/Fnr family transcriptional regulator n=1 Tax=Parabacteroides provencensis TaxID=1944636 RepID=UPI000C159F13|nr:Crp/Fnr family transcriptional regulator [Parabacteroides provencensis]
MDRIIKSINRIFRINDVALEKLTSCLRPIEIPKKTILIEPNRKNDNLYFIEKGIARSYNLINGKEITSWFSKEGELTYSTNSFYGKTEGYENEMIQILEDSLLYYIPIVELEKLCMEYADIANWLRILHQNAFVEMERRLIYRLYMSAEERYKDFSEKNPDLFQRVNLGYIASYLGMSHVTLCALRK